MNSITPGNQTSEHTIVLVCQLVAALFVSAGILDPNKAAALVNAIAVISGALISAAPAVAYIWGRTWLKGKAVSTGVTLTSNGTTTFTVPFTGTTAGATTSAAAGEQPVNTGTGDAGSQQ
jgi:hypothetical protein